jgi:tetratricopeptide (TPR) repeat protein
MANLSKNLLENLLQNFINCATVAQSLINQANIYQAEGNSELAIIFYQRAIALYPYYLKIHEKLKTLNISPTNYQPKKSQEYCQLGNQYSEKQEIFEAIVTYETAITFNQQNILAYQKLGELFINLEQWQIASHILEVAIWLNPNFPWNYQKLGEAYSHLEQWSQAKQAYQQTIKLIPDFPWAYYKLAKIQTQLGEISEAIINYQQVIKLKSDAWESWEKLIQLLIQVERYEEAIDYYQQVLQYQPTNRELCRKVSQYFEQIGDIERAIATYRQLLAFNPNSSTIYEKIGDMWSSAGNFTEAVTAYTQANKIQPSFLIYKKLGTTYHKLKQVDHAIQAHLESIKLNPDYPWAYYDLWNILAKKGDWDNAIQLYETILKIAPQAAYCWSYLGNVYIEKKQWQEAINCYEKAIDFNANLPQPYQRLAEILRREEKWDLTIKYYLKAVELNPDYDWEIVNLWKVLHTHHQLDAAKKIYEKIINNQPNTVNAYINLAKIYLRQGNIASAISNNRLATYYQTCQSHPDYMQKYDQESWQNITPQLPKFLVIGVGKGGTTAIFDYLTKHPQFLSPILKEIDFWSIEFSQGIDWYLSHFPVITDQAQWITGEASPSYLGNWSVPEKIKKYSPEIRLIIVLRNPVNRAISHYYHHVKVGKEDRNCTEAINYELNILKSNNNYNFHHYWKDKLYYLGTGVYIKFIQHWLKFFQREQFLILSSEEFEQTPNIVMSKLYDFLEISDHQLKKYPKIYAGSYPGLDSNLRQELNNYFRPYNEQLQNFLQQDFGW